MPFSTSFFTRPAPTFYTGYREFVAGKQDRLANVTKFFRRGR
jgi:hypothetical protein